ncbi:MAG: 16S rRNA (cytidine(1402)-2'-O)-methyltransferase [Bacteroidales bacterium]|nr:16S rRNA (cytidine(1402)-2'-O)-methyltransferase [Bacteroidales bacterium]
MAKLFLVPTPVGNMEDISLRALRLLREADLILAEDTRTSSHLLSHYDIHTPMLSHHKFNEHQTVEQFSRRIQAGENVALITDAGTPGISDPGFLLVRQCIEMGVEVECLPGATALIPAVVVSGLPNDRFFFEGFLPQKKGRQSRLKELSELPVTFILYESPYRVVKTLQQLAQCCGEERRASVSREISKKFEETCRGTLAELIQHFSQNEARGEFVICVAGRKED